MYLGGSRSEKNLRSINIDKLMKTTRGTFQTISRLGLLSSSGRTEPNDLLETRRGVRSCRGWNRFSSREINGGGELVDVSKLENNAWPRARRPVTGPARFDRFRILLPGRYSSASRIQLSWCVSWTTLSR